MADIYKVNSSGLNVRSGPGTGNKVVSAYPKNTTFISDGKIQNGWVHITSPVDGWSNATYLTKVSSTPPPQSPSTAPPPTPPASNVANTGGSVPVTSAPKTKELTHKYLKAFGCPPQFNLNTDIQYINDLTPGVGRVFANTMLSNPSILSICPGTVKYLPGFSKENKNTFYESVLGMVTSDDSLRSKIMADESSNILNGKLYEFSQDFTGYTNIVNYLCRLTAILMGVGDEKIPHGSQKLKNFDYAWWQTPEKTGAPDSPSVFGEILKNMKTMAGSAINDNTYVHFFATNSGTSISEDMSTSTTSSVLEESINSSSLHSVSRNLEFLFGGPIGGIEDSALEGDLNSLLNSSNSNFIKNIGGLAKNYFKGGRLIFPQMIDGINYSKAMNVSLKFISPYGDPLSIFLRLMVPTMHLLALTLPKQLAENMYTYPFIVRVFQKGWFNSDLAVISNLNIQRGGSDNTSWSVDGLPTEMDVSFDIVPLYSELMVSSSTKPFLALQNTALTEYLAVLTGVDLKVNNLAAKTKMAVMAVTNKFSDIPTNLSRGVVEGLSDELGKLFQIQNR